MGDARALVAARLMMEMAMRIFGGYVIHFLFLKKKVVSFYRNDCLRINE